MEWWRYRIDHPNLDCAVCERLYSQGDLADLPCEICFCNPAVVDYPDDRTSTLTFRFIDLAQGGLSSEQTPPWDLICAATGIEDLETFKEVWWRAGQVRRLHEEAERLKHPRRES